MDIITFTFNPFSENTYIIYDPETLNAAIVDPGMMSGDEINSFNSVIEFKKLKPIHLINTHLHADHAAADSYISQKYGLKLKANANDQFLATSLSEQLRMFGLPDNVEPLQIEEPIKEGDIIKIGKGQLKVIEIPGHSPGGIALYDEEGMFVLTGDSLFRQSIGRTDLPGGDYATLINSIQSKLSVLPEYTSVYPGHGESTTIGMEKASNPYL